MVVLGFILTPPLEKGTIVVFTSVYVLSLSLVLMPLGLLGYCLEANYDRAIRQMPMDSDRITRLQKRLMALPFC